MEVLSIKSKIVVKRKKQCLAQCHDGCQCIQKEAFLIWQSSNRNYITCPRWYRDYWHGKGRKRHWKF